jgi:cytosine/adenosine deaminase-related metal-dependent hydrolase
MAKVGVRAAHCPRSNKRLQCPYAPIREMLDVGVLVGLGMDSPASGSTIDMFAEMRAALKLSQERRAPLSPEEVWNMATTMGALSLGTSDWKIQKGSHVPLIQIWISDAASTKDLIQKSSPELVRWVKS